MHFYPADINNINDYSLIRNKNVRLSELKDIKPKTQNNFPFNYERMKRHAESKTVEIPKGLTREEKMAWLMGYSENES